MIRKLCTHAGIVALALSSASGVVNPVQITTSANGSVQLLRNGTPYLLKGVGGFANPAVAAACGANSIRTWGTENAQANLDTAHAHGLTATLGIWLPHDANYNDAAFRSAWRTTVNNLANTYKNHPALLFWALGNELNIPANYTGTWTLLQELAAIIKSIDPNHPVMTVLAGAPSGVLSTLASTCPSIDLVGFNVYAGLDGVPSAVAAAPAWTKPYLITEWGPNGHWESANTPWGRPIESHSAAKASLYSTRAALIDSWRPRCLGSYVFFWDQKQERTPTWYSMFLEKRPLSGVNGEACPTVDAMAQAWSGSVPGNRAPVFVSATLNGTAAPGYWQAAPGKVETIAISATDPDGNSLTVIPEVLKEPSQLGDLGSWEGRPEALGDNARASGHLITLVMPPAGQYRLFATILDGQGKAATWNMPLLSSGTALNAAAQPFHGSPRPVPGTIQAEEFDKGGLGVSYSDTTPPNEGGALRNTAVDIETCTDSGGGHSLGWLAAGEWLHYRISAATAVTVRPKIRVANQNQGGIVRLLLNGTNISGNLTIPSTGGWQSWQDVQSPSSVSIPAGNHTLRLEVVANGPNNSAVGNLNSITLEATAAAVPVVSYALWQGTQGLAFSKQIPATNSPTGYALATGNLPGGLALNTSTGLVSGTPVVSGNFTASFSASNAAGTSTPQTIGFAIAPTTKPVINSALSANATMGTPFAYQITASNSPISFSATGLPGGLALNTASGAITGTPTLYGSYAAKISATNANGTTTQNLSLTVAPVLPLITNNGSASGRAGSAFSYRIMATNVPRSFAASGLPAGLTLNATSGAITGIPASAGNTTVTLSATNPAGTVTKAITFVIVPQPPSITTVATANGTVGQAHSRAISTTNNPVKFSAIGLPPGLTINATSGIVGGTPTVDGTYLSRVTATNAGGSSTQNLTYSIAPVRPVLTNNGTLTVRAGTPVNYRITAVNAPRSFAASGLPGGLTVNATSGLISGTPSIAGNFSMNLTATNPAGTGFKNLPAVVLPMVPVITSSNTRSAAVSQPFSHQITASNSPTRFGASGLPAGLTVNGTTGLLSGSPMASGLFAAKLTAMNAGGTATQNFTLTVTAAVPMLTGNTTARAHTGVFFSHQITARNSPATFGAVGLPPGWSVNSTTGYLSGTTSFLGTANFTLTAANSAGSASLPFSVTALPVDPHDLRYVRIKALGGGMLLANGPSPVQVAVATPQDARSHWSLEAALPAGAVRIRNRHSGLVLDMQDQSGSVRAGNLTANFTSTAWVASGSAGNLSFSSAWQPDQFLFRSLNSTLGHAANGGLGTAARFALEDLPGGATVPWTTYDETNHTSLGAPAEVISNSYNGSFNIHSRAAEASKQGCILLNGFGTSVRWTAIQPADALTLRYCVDDGVTGHLTLKLSSTNGTVRTRKIPVTSAQAWVYFDAAGQEFNTPAAGRTPAKRYNEARLRFSQADGGGIQAGDTIELVRDPGDAMVWIDLLETEVASFAPAPGGSLNAKTGFGALGDGLANDTAALKNAIATAAAQRKALYIPAGVYRLDSELILPAGVIVQGAGVWHTEFHFTANGSESSGGLKGNGSGIVLRDIYLRGTQTAREGGFKALKGWWGVGSTVENLWIEQTTVGAWIADFNASTTVTDRLQIRNCRIRNTFADGINMASGTKNSIVENCHIRGTGDDGLATWSSGRELGKPPTYNQIFRYNTIQCVYRAGGIGVFGGAGHKIHHNRVEDTVSGPGFRANSVFQTVNNVATGWPFGTVVSQIYQNIFERTGSVTHFSEPSAAIELQAWQGPVQALRFCGNRVEGARHQAVRLSRIGNVSGATFQSLVFEDSSVTGVSGGLAVDATSAGSLTIDPGVSSAGISNSNGALKVLVR